MCSPRWIAMTGSAGGIRSATSSTIGTSRSWSCRGGPARARARPSRPARACLQSSEPEADHADGQHGAIVDPALLVAGRDPAVLLQAVDQPLDPVPEPVRLAVEAGPAALALLGRDDRRDAATPELPPGLRTAVGLVARHPPGPQARPAP